VLISQVFKGTPADKSGLKRGDVITEYEGKKVASYRELQEMIASTDVGTEAKLKIMRDGEEKDVSVKVGERKPEVTEAMEQPAQKEGEESFGITVSDITPDIAQQYGISAKIGVVVTDVTDNSPADEAGIMKGDVIHEINSVEIKNTDDFEKAVKGKTERGRDVVVLIERGNAMIYLAFTMK
jgi:serine protease Do